MKPIHPLLKYIHYYHYIYLTETIGLMDRPKKQEAEAVYRQHLDDHPRIQHDPLQLWMFHVALDCIRTMPAKERNNLLAVEDISMLHFSYGLYIRNHYIYRSRLHGKHWSADDLSLVAIDLMRNILRPTSFEP